MRLRPLRGRFGPKDMQYRSPSSAASVVGGASLSGAVWKENEEKQ